MSKQLLISIQPQHLCNILTGKKTLEIRKQIPLNYVGWVNLYCTKGKPYLNKEDVGNKYFLVNGVDYMGYKVLNGSIPCRFWFDEHETMDTDYSMWVIAPKRNKEILEQACLTWEEADKYSNYKPLYAMHIKKLEIFEKSKALSEYYTIKDYERKNIWKDMDSYIGVVEVDGELKWKFTVTNAPQNYMYVEVEE